ncbi:MAG: hypothetical protein ACHQ2Z_15530 [Elusimicrobiota bacterium]
MTSSLILAVVLGAAANAQPPVIERPGPQCIAAISDKEAAEIGSRIWEHEGGGKLLIWWDATAECASFGINNYLWFQRGLKVPFQESFPPLIDYMLSKGANVPQWIRSKPPAPWSTRTELFAETAPPGRIRNDPKRFGLTADKLAKTDSPRMKELREFLESTVALQARFSIQRMIDSLPKMLAAVPESARPAIEKQFYRVACSHGGQFDLVDYANFKGEGTNPIERYKSPSGEMQGWGLLQVLQHMKGDDLGPPALNEFADSSEWVIRRRVDNAPPERRDGDRRWLALWVKRIQDYRGG